ncbi:F-box/WD repeat-containing protein 7-like [Protopterus annectens]|uniref:F-box/WD repeat-containing protein 7-like n=1 Tax=Protopterus annectens TaxID=7888 RepID=UPI001CFA3B9B|nr:F-box/WD repeat-containing protein 7-like [Protopterus annectens]
MSKVPSLTPVCFWKEVYCRAAYLQQNWAKGRYTVVPLLRGHRKRVNCLDCDGQYVVSGSDDKSARVWNLFTAHCLHVLDVHTDAVTCVVIKNDYVLTGCADNHIRIFRVQTGVFMQTLMGHSASIEHLCFDGHRVLSASADRTLRVWTLELGCCKHVLTGHEDDIQLLTMQDTLAVSTSWDRYIRMWDLETGNCIKSLSSQNQVVHCCQFDSRFLIFGGSEGLVVIIETGKEPDDVNGMHRCEGHSSDVYCLVFNEKIVCSGSADSTIRVWDFTGKCLFTFYEHIGVVRCLHLHGNRLVSGGDRKKIVVWDVQAGMLLNVVHRNPTLLHKWWVNETRIITASPESPGTLTILSYW